MSPFKTIIRIIQHLLSYKKKVSSTRVEWLNLSKNISISAICVRFPHVNTGRNLLQAKEAL